MTRLPRIRRTRVNCALGLVVSAPLWLPLHVVELIARGVAIACERANAAVGAGVMAFYETTEQARDRNRAARREWLRERAGQWLRFSAWICACPGVWGRGMDVCETCGTARPSLETMPAREARA